MQREPGLTVQQKNLFDRCAVNWVPVEAVSSTAASKFFVELKDGLLGPSAGFLGSNACTANDRSSWVLCGNVVSKLKCPVLLASEVSGLVFLIRLIIN
jgi:hypothetical protein